MSTWIVSHPIITLLVTVGLVIYLGIRALRGERVAVVIVCLLVSGWLVLNWWGKREQQTELTAVCQDRASQACQDYQRQHHLVFQEEYVAACADHQSLACLSYRREHGLTLPDAPIVGHAGPGVDRERQAAAERTWVEQQRQEEQNRQDRQRAAAQEARLARQQTPPEWEVWRVTVHPTNGPAVLESRWVTEEACQPAVHQQIQQRHAWAQQSQGTPGGMVATPTGVLVGKQRMAGSFELAWVCRRMEASTSEEGRTDDSGRVTLTPGGMPTYRAQPKTDAWNAPAWRTPAKSQ